jgi:hypothetical protein
MYLSGGGIDSISLSRYWLALDGSLDGLILMATFPTILGIVERSYRASGGFDRCGKLWVFREQPVKVFPLSLLRWGSLLSQRRIVSKGGFKLRDRGVSAITHVISIVKVSHLEC